MPEVSGVHSRSVHSSSSKHHDGYSGQNHRHEVRGIPPKTFWELGPGKRETSTSMTTKLEKKMSWVIALLAVALAMLTLPQAALADDDDPPGRVARLNYIQGSVSFEPAGEQDWVQAFTNRPVTTGDRIWADQGARAELQMGAATIRLNDSTGFSFLNLDDRTVQIELTEGTVDIRVRRLDRDEIFEVDTPNQAFTILRPGRYRIQASGDGNSTYVVVRTGEGEATGGGQTYTMRSGESGTFTGTDYLEANVYSSGDRDDFDNWGDEREHHYDDSRSARYVSPDVVGYQDLDDYGSWSSDSQYGNVWMPTRVNSDWAPYRQGHWAWISPWGWTWVDDEPWGYAPYHYGRWVSLRGRWGWVPGPREVRPVYAPALVVFIGGGSHFGGGGGFGINVGWFPLGPREVYVPSYNVSPRYVERVNVSNTTVSTTTITNVYNTQIINNNVTNITYVNRTVPGGVTAVPQNTFTSAQPVARAVVRVNQQQIAAAPITRRAAVVPTRNSVLGPAAPEANRVARPPAAIAQRSVVAKAPPPPPPVSFEKQQKALEAHPGQPLARHEVETLRPARVAAERPQVRQAPPGKPATPNTNRPNANRPGGQPDVGNSRQPANAPPPNTANKPGNAPEANAPGQRPQPGRNDGPPSAQQQAEQTRQQQQADKAREQQANQQQQQEEKARTRQEAQQQADQARKQQDQQQADRARQRQETQQQADQARKQQQDQQQADKVRQQQADQQQADQARKQQDQQQADRARQRQEAQQQADQARKQQQDQQQADRARQRQEDQQQADRARQRQEAQQQADQARQRQTDQQQADRARQQQEAQQQADQARQRQADQQQADRARQRQADQQRPDRPPNAQPGERPKNQPPEAQPKRPLTKEEKAREEQKKREEKQPPQ
jgi:hypothetical protein